VASSPPRAERRAHFLAGPGLASYPPAKQRFEQTTVHQTELRIDVAKIDPRNVLAWDGLADVYVAEWSPVP
jgi:hypothetical protein